MIFEVVSSDLSAFLVHSVSQIYVPFLHQLLIHFNGFHEILRFCILLLMSWKTDISFLVSFAVQIRFYMVSFTCTYIFTPQNLLCEPNKEKFLLTSILVLKQFFLFPLNQCFLTMQLQYYKACLSLYYCLSPQIDPFQGNRMHSGSKPQQLQRCRVNSFELLLFLKMTSGFPYPQTSSNVISL